jgi:hypothetical protein
MNPTAKQLLIAAALAALTACGGGSSSSSTTLFLKGPITARAAGQIQVAGVTVTTPATVQIEGAQHPESELHDGMVVRVKAHGSGHHAEGTEIEFEDSVKGTVGTKTSDDLLVSGQTVHVDDSTEFEDNSARLGSILSGDRVRVSGVPDDRGGIRATRIDKTADVSHELELKGYVSALSATGFTLKLSPDAAAASTYTVTLAAGVTLPAGLANGAFVEVRSESAIAAGNAIVASGVVLEDGSVGEAGQESEVEGIVTSGSSASFVVAGTTVTTTASTRWDGGVPADLAVGSRVEAEGLLDASGVLAAEKVSFKANVRLIGRVTDKLGASTAATFKVNGVAVKGDVTTDWRTSGDVLANGDWIEVRGQADRTGAAVVASRVQVQSAGNARPVFQGLATTFDAAAGTVTILGAVISSSGAEFHSQGDASGADGPLVSKDVFFSGLTAGVSLVKATGGNAADWTAGPTSAARSLEVEGER